MLQSQLFNLLAWRTVIWLVVIFGFTLVGLYASVGMNGIYHDRALKKLEKEGNSNVND